MRNFFLGFLAALLGAGVVMGAYFVGRWQKIPSFKPITTTELSESVEEMPTRSAFPQPSSDDTELIKQALIKKNNWTGIELELTLTYNDGTYAKGGVREKGSDVGGGYFFAKKADGEWKIVADGNGAITCDSLIPYPDYPSFLIPECFDEETGATKRR